MTSAKDDVHQIFCGAHISTGPIEDMHQAEEALAADTIKFDTFLKKNDEEVQAVVQASDLQTKRRQDKVIIC